MRILRTGLSLLLLTGAFAIAACEGFLEVENPGGIQDAALDGAVVFPALVFGMEEDLGAVLNQLTPDVGVMADEWTYVGTGLTQSNYAAGIIRDDEVDGHWNRIQVARWVAEDGLERMLRVLGADRLQESPLAVRANLVAGFANRVMGEVLCEVVFDGGPAESHTVAFERAEKHFSEAARMAERQGLTDYRYAALGGRASVRAWLGNWSGAAEDAVQVPAAFSYEQMYWSPGATAPSPGIRGINEVWRESYNRSNFTVAESRWAELRDDPRVPSDTLYLSSGAVRPAADGVTAWIQQKKYTLPSSDLPLVKGTELLLLRAEGQLRAGNVGQAVTLINQHRNYYGLGAVTPSGESATWELLKDERAAEVWLESRRLWDLRRWQDPFLTGRDSCIPISDRERRTNPNLSGG